MFSAILNLDNVLKGLKMPGISEQILHKALKGLDQWRRGISLDEYIDRIRRENHNSAKTVADLLFNLFRHRAKTEAVIKHLCRGKIKPDVKHLLLAAMTQMEHQDGIAPESAVNVAVDYAKRKFGRKTGGFVNAVLRNHTRMDFDKFIAQQPEFVRMNLPETVWRLWKKRFSKEEIQKLSNMLAQKAPFSFRLCGELPEPELNSIEAERIGLPEWAGDAAFFSCPDPGVLLQKNWLKDGIVYIQDPSTAMSPNLAELSGNELVLDLCAAPGGKTILIGEKLASGTVVGCDRSLKRQRLTLENLASRKFQSSVVVASALAPSFRSGSFDLVLADVPCSNTGVFRRRPDTLWRFTENTLNDVVKLQRQILSAAAKLVKPGGKLIYGTCSIEPKENDEQIAAFAESHCEFKLVKSLLLLPDENFDGAFGALLERN